jgi:hypothetical protein
VKPKTRVQNRLRTSDDFSGQRTNHRYNSAVMHNPRNALRLVIALCVVLAASGYSPAATKAARKSSASSTNYHGWADALLLTNSKVESVIVPAIGRVMQFNFVGEDGVFWENPALQGKTADPTAKEWANFGGDKSWPSPQSDWQKMIGRGWPPPATFDSTPLQAKEEGSAVELISPADAAYGIRVHRLIKLDAAKPVLTITTTYEKVSGDPVKVGIGVITQLRDPQRVFIKLPEKSEFPDGYILINFEKPQDGTLQDGLFSLTRSHKYRSQIGNDGSSLLWMNEKCALRIDSPRVKGAEYPWHNSSAVIYTNADPDAYVELETYGPLSTMKVGDKIQRTNVYTLSRRSENEPEAEAKRLLK